MPTQKIPCADCAAKKEEIELGGRYRVVGCEPILASPGWCLISYTEVAFEAALETDSFQEIPCTECAQMKEEIELGGRFKVTTCDPVPSKAGWCLIRYERLPDTR